MTETSAQSTQTNNMSERFLNFNDFELTNVKKKEGRTGSPDVPQAWKTSAKTAFFANKAMNAEKKKYDTERSSLLATMADSDVSEFSFQTRNGDNQVIGLTVALETPVQDKVNVLRLIELMGLEAVLPLLTASKAVVTEAFGTKIASQVTTPTEGNENVKISTTK